MRIALYEDDGFGLLYPLTYLRPVFDLRCGVTTLREKVQEKFPDSELHLEVREALEEVVGCSFDAAAVNGVDRLGAEGGLLLVNAGAILTSPAESYAADEGVAVTGAGDIIWARLKAETARELDAGSARELATMALDKFEGQTTDDILIKYPWDLINANPAQIISDFELLYGAGDTARLAPGVAVAGKREDLFVGHGAEVQPCTFIDCREGPVIIEAGAVVHAHSSIHGPACIGPNSYLMEARVREGTTIGPVCRAGGEIEESIIHGYSNKYHTGFLGHSYVCEWVNLGALTTNSDLKNDYSNVSVYVNGRAVDTGSMKVGSFIGDHTKTSIGTMLNTGCSIGIMCNLMAGPSVLPKFIPSFAWYLNGRIGKSLGLAQALKTAEAAMGRRGVELTPAMVNLIKYTEELTRPVKMAKIKRERRKAFKK